MSGLIAIAALSGFAGLGYEIVWTRQLALSFGHEYVATLCVLAGFFAGLAMGAAILSARAMRARRPARWYAAMEALIALWAVAQLALFPWATGLVIRLMGTDPGAGTQAAVLTGATALLLMPATVAMGGTLPALAAMLERTSPGRRAATTAYAANTLGAVIGTLATTFVTIPSLGMRASLLVLATANVICAVAAWRRAEGTNETAVISPPPPTGRSVLPALFVTGLCGIGFEVIVVRVFAEVLENTIYTVAGLLSVYLLGTGLGAAAFRRAGAWMSVERLAVACAMACVAAAFVLSRADLVLAAIRSGQGDASLGGGIGAELALGAIVFLPPTVVMGALFGALAERAAERGQGGFGRALAVNTIGAAMAPVVFGTLLLPLAGARLAVALSVAGYLTLAWPHRRLGRARWAAAAAVIALVTGGLAASGDLRFVEVPPGGRVVAARDGVMAAVSVVEEPNGDRHLQVNSHFRMGGTASARSDRRQAHVPLLLHPDPRSALFLGLGTGGTIAAAADYPGLIADGVELVPEVLPLLSAFEAATGAIADNPAIRLHVGDARRFVRASDSSYDVIVADLYHPALDGSGAMYAREHFAAIRARLSPGGVFCQWLPLHQLDLPTLRLIVRTFLEVFPDARASLAHLSIETPLIGLIATAAPARMGDADQARRLDDAGLRRAVAATGPRDAMELFGDMIADGPALRAWAGPGPVNTDDVPRVTYMAPRAAYAMSEPVSTRLLALLSALHPDPAGFVAGGPAMAARLSAYWAARDRFLSLGASTALGGDPRDILARVAPELIAIVRISPDFEPAYLPVLSMARGLAGADPASARGLLFALDRANPARGEARALLARLPGG